MTEPRRWTAIDVETTGGGRDDRIIQIGVVSFIDGFPLSTWSAYIKPDPWKSSNAFSQDVHRISPDLLRRAPSFSKKLYDRLMPYLTIRGPVVAHHVCTERRFLEYEAKRLGLVLPDTIDWQCSLKAAKRILGRNEGVKLDVLCAELGIPLPRHHDALMDAQACGALWDKLFRLEQAQQQAAQISVATLTPYQPLRYLEVTR